MSFFTPGACFQTCMASKIHTRFQTWPLRHYVNITLIRTPPPPPPPTPQKFISHPWFWRGGGGVGVCSLRTADAFPVVASLPFGGGQRSDDRICVCCSQARGFAVPFYCVQVRKSSSSVQTTHLHPLPPKKTPKVHPPGMFVLPFFFHILFPSSSLFHSIMSVCRLYTFWMWMNSARSRIRK